MDKIKNPALWCVFLTLSLTTVAHVAGLPMKWQLGLLTGASLLSIASTIFFDRVIGNVGGSDEAARAVANIKARRAQGGLISLRLLLGLTLVWASLLWTAAMHGPVLTVGALLLTVAAFVRLAFWYSARSQRREARLRSAIGKLLGLLLLGPFVGAAGCNAAANANVKSVVLNPTGCAAVDIAKTIADIEQAVASGEAPAQAAIEVAIKDGLPDLLCAAGDVVAIETNGVPKGAAHRRAMYAAGHASGVKCVAAYVLVFQAEIAAGVKAAGATGAPAAAGR